MASPLRGLAAVALSAVIAVTGALPAQAEPEPPAPAGAPRADQALTEPTYDDPASRYTIPDTPGTTYTVNGDAIGAGTHEVVFPEAERPTVLTFEATAANGAKRTWRHQFPYVHEPEAPRFKSQEQYVFAPGQWGVHYVVIHDGKEQKLNPNSWNDMSAYGGNPLRFEARPNANTVLLKGQTSWEHRFAPRPDYPLDHGDEFNDGGVSKNWYIYDGRPTGKGRHSADNVSVITTPEGEGVLNLRSRRHCVSSPEEKLTDANATEEVCPEGKETIYSGTNMLSRHVHKTPKSIEIRAKMDAPHDGVTLAAWAHNDQQFCREEYPDTNIAEMDVLEVWGTKASIATTHMDCGPSGFPRYSVGMDKDLPGEWHTWRVEYDGYAIRYFLDGVRLDGDRGPHVTPETIGVSQKTFSHVMNDYAWQTIIGTKFPQNGSWAPFVDDSKPFREHNDQIDYVRVEDFDLSECQPYGEIGKLAATRPDLGAPQSCESDTFTPGGRVQVFENGRIYWSPSTGAHAVWGAIGDRYIEMGGDRVLGLPTGPELTGLRDNGASQKFTGGTMFWSMETGAHFAKGEILRKYADMGWENHDLGYPITDEICGMRDNGCFQRFQHHTGHIYWSPATGAHFTRGLIHQKYGELGYETNARLGYPITDEICGMRDGGCFQRFQHENTHIYWSPATGAHFTRGLIHQRYGEMGWEKGTFGYPVTDEICGIRGGGCFQRFQHERGHIYWSPASGSWDVRGEIFKHWGSQGWETGRWGYPVGPERCVPDKKAGRACTQKFQHGQARWNPITGVR